MTILGAGIAGMSAACALAEAVWSSKASHDWNGFQQRLTVDEKRLDELGVNYRHEHGVQ